MARSSGQDPHYLSKREQQIMDLAYAQGKITAADLVEKMPDSPSNSSVRTFLRILEEKGHMQHVEEDGRYVYMPTRSRQTAARSAVSRLVDVFFAGSAKDLVATLLSEREADLSDAELAEIRELIDRAQKKEAL